MAIVGGISRDGAFEHWTEETTTFRTRVVRGQLRPDLAGPRIRSQTAAVSRGTGDDAGHLIARRFGGPDAPWNLGRQNWLQNRSKGTYYAIEARWADVLKEGATVYVTVSEQTRLELSGEPGDRALYRQVIWKITPKQGRVEAGMLSFLNTDSARVRAALGIQPEATYSDNAYSISTGKRIRQDLGKEETVQ